MKTILEYNQKEQTFQSQTYDVKRNLPQKENTNGFQTVCTCNNNKEAWAIKTFLQTQIIDREKKIRFEEVKFTAKNLQNFISLIK